MREPSIKGTMFRNSVEDLRALLDSGEIAQEELARELKPEEIAYLDQDIQISSWYPIASHARLLALVAKRRAHGSPEYHVEGGRQAARRVLEMGIYAQLEGCPEGAWGDRVGRILVTLAESFFNFTKWKWRGLQGDGFSIVVSGAKEMPEEVALRNQGFVEYLASRAAQGKVRVTYRRSPDRDEYELRARRVR